MSGQSESVQDVENGMAVAKACFCVAIFLIFWHYNNLWMGYSNLLVFLPLYHKVSSSARIGVAVRRGSS